MLDELTKDREHNETEDARLVLAKQLCSRYHDLACLYAGCWGVMLVVCLVCMVSSMGAGVAGLMACMSCMGFVSL